MEINLKKQLVIDDQQLDLEWLQQTELAVIYGQHWADCKKAVQEATRQREQIRAKLISMASKDPVKYLGADVKPTGGNIESFYRQHDKFIECTANLDNAVYQLDIADVNKKEICITRKQALQALTDLLGNNYFAGPATPRNLQEVRKQRHTEVTKKIGARMSKMNKN